MEGGGWRVEGGGWRVEGGGWRVVGGGWVRIRGSPGANEPVPGDMQLHVISQASHSTHKGRQMEDHGPTP